MRWLSRKQRIALVCGAAALGLAALGSGGWSLARSGIAAAAAARSETALAAGGKALGFAVETVTVEGRERVGRQAILAALKLERGTPIFAVDLAAARARLEALPWVRRADVARELPDTITVRLEERRPLAFWQRQGKLVLIDRDGTVIPEQQLDRFGNLVVLVGDDAPKLGAGLIDMLAREPALMPHVAAAVRVGGRRWNLKLDSGIDIALPEADAEEAWHRLAALDRSEGVLERDILAVDLRLPDRLVLRLPPQAVKPIPPKKKSGKPT